MTTAGTLVGRLRVRCAGVDSTSAQLRLGAQLSSVSLRPRALPPSALLCVRSLDDPLPGTIRLDGLQLGPPTEWERAAEDALDRALRDAARPAHGPVPAGAGAVLFADRAELLACLARDALDGTAWTRWWWAALMRSAASGLEPIAAAWLAEPAYVPAAFGLLARSGRAAAYARTLRATHALELAVRVARVFAASEVVRALMEAGTVAAPAEPDVAAQPAPPRRRRGVEPPSREPASKEAWIALVPEADTPGLSIQQEILLAVSLILTRAPARAREPLFARAVSQALRIGTSRAAREPAPVPNGREDPKAADVGQRARPRRPAVHRVVKLLDLQRARDAGAAPRSAPPGGVEPASDPQTEPSAAGRPTPARPRLPAPAPRRGKPAVAHRRSRPPSTAPSRPQEAPHAAVDVTEQRRGVVSRPAERATPRAPQAPRVPTPGPEEQPFTKTGVETELGGLFFLLNVGLFLGLYGDFTTPDAPGIALDPWDFVALVGATLLGREASRDDAAWPLLAGLAGRRPRERPGRSFEPPSDWRIPAAWLEPFEEEGDWLWSAARGTLRIVHPAGFAVAVVALRGRDPQTVLRRELRRYGARPALRRASLPAESRMPLRRWVRRLGAYVAARIQVAMGDPDRAHAVGTVLRRHANVFATETHVDVSLSLFALPIEIRLAGLDRDPGWIPAAGRFVAFHFE